LNKGFFASLDKLALRKNMMPPILEIFFRREESSSSLHALFEITFLHLCGFPGPKKPEKMAKISKEESPNT